MRAKRESWSQVLLAEIVETEGGNCYVSQRHALFCEESLGKNDAEMLSFPGTGRSTNSIAWNSWLLLNKWILQWNRLWRGYKLVGRCKLSLYENESCEEHAVYFWRWLKWRAMFITFLLSSNDLYLYTRMFWRKYSLNILKNTRPSIKWEVNSFSEEILLRVELIASLIISYLISKLARLAFLLQVYPGSILHHD